MIDIRSKNCFKIANDRIENVSKNKNVYLGDVKASDKADKVSRLEAAS